MADVLDKDVDLSSKNNQLDCHVSKSHMHSLASTNDEVELSIVQKVMKSRLEQLELESGSSQEGESFFVADLGYVHRQYISWTRRIPRVLPYYAVKCSPDPVIISFLASLGSGFDCASSTEMQIVLSQGIEPERIIFSNTCKMNQDLRFARAHDIRKTTFDNADELHKIKNIFPSAQLLVRIDASDKQALYNLSDKFGASEESAKRLLQLAKKLLLNVIGVSFHVGSGAVDPQAYETAIHGARRLFHYGHKLGFEMQSLDIGGGFGEKTFPLMSEQVTHSLNNHFPEEDVNVEICAEPGRFFVEGAMTLACNVIARRGAEDSFAEGAVDMLYLNDGLYGNFLMCAFEPPPMPQVFYGNGYYFPDVLNREKKEGESTYIIWGPTCDACDFINKNVKLRKGLGIGDWLYYDNMGAYTTCTSTTFNGFLNKRNIIYVGTTPMSNSFLEDQKPLEDSRSSVYSLKA